MQRILLPPLSSVLAFLSPASPTPQTPRAPRQPPHSKQCRRLSSPGCSAATWCPGRATASAPRCTGSATRRTSAAPSSARADVSTAVTRFSADPRQLLVRVAPRRAPLHFLRVSVGAPQALSQGALVAALPDNQDRPADEDAGKESRDRVRGTGRNARKGSAGAPPTEIYAAALSY